MAATVVLPSPSTPPLNDIYGFFSDNVECARNSIEWARRLPLEEIANYTTASKRFDDNGEVSKENVNDNGYLFSYIVESIANRPDRLSPEVYIDVANLVAEMFADRDEIRFVRETSIDHLIAVLMMRMLCANAYSEVHRILTPVVLDAFFDIKVVFDKIRDHRGMAEATTVEVAIPCIILAAMTSDNISYESYYDIAYIAMNTITANVTSAPMVMTMIQILAEITTAPNEVAECLIDLGALSVFRTVVVLNSRHYASHLYSASAYGSFYNAANDKKVFEDVVLGIGNLIAGADFDQVMAVVNSGILPIVLDKGCRVNDSMRVFIANSMALTGLQIGMLDSFCEETLFVDGMMDFLIRVSASEDRTDRKSAIVALDVFSQNCPVTVATAIGDYSSSMTTDWIRGVRKSARVLKKVMRRVRRATSSGGDDESVSTTTFHEEEGEAGDEENAAVTKYFDDASVTTFNTTEYSYDVEYHSIAPSPVAAYSAPQPPPPPPPTPTPADHVACPISTPIKLAASPDLYWDVLDRHERGYFIVETSHGGGPEFMNAVEESFRSSGASIIDVKSGPKLATALKRSKDKNLFCVKIPQRLVSASTVWNAIRDFIETKKVSDISFWVFVDKL